MNKCLIDIKRISGPYTKVAYRIMFDAENRCFELQYYNYGWNYAGDFDSEIEAEKALKKRDLMIYLGETVML